MKKSYSRHLRGEEKPCEAMAFSWVTISRSLSFLGQALTSCKVSLKTKVWETHKPLIHGAINSMLNSPKDTCADIKFCHLFLKFRNGSKSTETNFPMTDLIAYASGKWLWQMNSSQHQQKRFRCLLIGEWCFGFLLLPPEWVWCIDSSSWSSGGSHRSAFEKYHAVFGRELK